MHKASMRKSETFEQTVHRQEQNRMRMASMRESAAPRVWHFSAFHRLVNTYYSLDASSIGIHNLETLGPLVVLLLHSSDF